MYTVWNLLIAVKVVVAADAGKSVRGAAAADDTTGADAEEPMHVAQDCSGNLCWTSRALIDIA